MTNANLQIIPKSMFRTKILPSIESWDQDYWEPKLRKSCFSFDMARTYIFVYSSLENSECEGCKYFHFVWFLKCEHYCHKTITIFGISVPFHFSVKSSFRLVYACIWHWKITREINLQWKSCFHRFHEISVQNHRRKILSFPLLKDISWNQFTVWVEIF